MGSKLFCIDGTNLVRTAYGYGGPGHRAQEQADTERLVEIFARLCEEHDGDFEVELYFDGAFRPLPAARSSNLRVRFTHEFPADDLILDRVRARAYGGGGAVTVVTADSELMRRAADEGGRALRVPHGTPPEDVARRIGGRLAR